METIVVPAPPKSAFNKKRPVSDLVRKQVEHFQHVAQKHGMKIDPALERDLATEGGAARYIARVTREMRGQSERTPGPRLVARPPGTAKSKPAAAGLDLAAAADRGRKPGAGKATKDAGRTPKKSSSGGKGGGKRKR
ncbi:MAG TPA: hypothetical protein VHE33_11460 [Acidobacteriaceae bacterium]|nr:hypothetical protein [Acidobacteriaceae bacterium]